MSFVEEKYDKISKALNDKEDIITDATKVSIFDGNKFITPRPQATYKDESGEANKPFAVDEPCSHEPLTLCGNNSPAHLLITEITPDEIHFTTRMTDSNKILAKGKMVRIKNNAVAQAYMDHFDVLARYFPGKTLEDFGYGNPTPKINDWVKMDLPFALRAEPNEKSKGAPVKNPNLKPGQRAKVLGVTDVATKYSKRKGVWIRIRTDEKVPREGFVPSSHVIIR